MIPTANDEAYEDDQSGFSNEEWDSFIQIKLIDGSTIYTSWRNETQWAKDHPDIAEARRLQDFSIYLNVGERPFIARKRFIKGAPEYECYVYPRNVISLSLVSAGWENIIDDGQEPVYLYKEEIYALLNAARPNKEYAPPALDNAIDALLDALNGNDEVY